MDMTAREIRNAYQRAWNAKNPDKLKQYRENYWKRKAEECHQGKEAGTRSKIVG